MPSIKKNNNAFGMKTGTKSSRAPKLSKPTDRLNSMTPEQQKRIMEQRKKIKGFGK